MKKNLFFAGTIAALAVIIGTITVLRKKANNTPCHD
jgi:hypothetical protein